MGEQRSCQKYFGCAFEGFLASFPAGQLALASSQVASGLQLPFPQGLWLCFHQKRTRKGICQVQVGLQLAVWLPLTRLRGLSGSLASRGPRFLDSQMDLPGSGQEPVNRLGREPRCWCRGAASRSPQCCSIPAAPQTHLLLCLTPPAASNTEIHQTLPSGPGATAFPLPAIPAPPVFRGILLVIVPVSMDCHLPRKDFPDDLIPRKDPSACHLSPFVVFFIILR